MSDAAPEEPRGELTTSTMAMPKDTNPSGDIFGGWLMSEMDIAGSIAAWHRARGRVATVAVRGMAFHLPVHLDSTEGVPGWRYRHLWVDAEDIDGRAIKAVTYIADSKETDGNPSLRYITLLRDGAQAHGLPEHYLRLLDGVKHAE